MAEEATSRLCVKNIPVYVDESRLREHFSEKGEITDAKIIRAGDGHSRQFGFIGFKTVEDATAALEYFNNSYLDTSRLTIQYAYQRGASELPRPWSKYTAGTSAHSKAHPELQPEKPAKQKKKKGKGSKVDEGEGDEKLQEFLQVMQPRRKTAIWTNDAAAVATGRGKPGQPGQKQAATAAAQRREGGGNSSDEDEELYEDLPAARAGKRRASDAAESSEEDEADEPAAADPAVTDAHVSDLDYLKSRVRTSLSDDEELASQEAGSSSEEEDESDEDAEEAGGDALEEADEDAVHEDEDADDADEERRRSGGEAGPAPQVVQASDAMSAISETGRLFLRNLSYAATEDDLTQLLRPYGELQEVHLVLDRATKRSKGIALVQFVEASEAVEAHAALDGTVFQGRLLHILPGQRPPQPKPTADDLQAGKGGFKGQREADRRANAGQRSAWNTLFMRQDTVAEAVAAHLGVTKAELLDPEAPDMALRQALGETQVLAKTQSALGDAGVAIEKLEEAAMAAGKAADGKAVPRSPTVLLVKNLPFSVTHTELQDMFGRFGEIGRLVLPDTHVLALVEFLDAADARRAFKGLAYRRLQHVPLYLEWAPAGIFNGPAAAHKAKPAPPAAKSAEAADVAATVDFAPDETEAEPHTLYVKNLAWKTGDAALRKYFDKAASAIGGSCRSAKVAMRQDKKAPDGKPLSMGFGFVECSSEDAAKTVMRQLQGTMLDGHKLVIQLSQRKRLASDADKAKAKEADKANSTKLVVRNVAFEGTRKDIVGLFGPYGHIKSARLPRKFDGTHRGFAFVDFASKQEAQAALDAVAGTHLYGRRLVVEWAEDESGLDELRAKTAAKFHDDDDPATARPKKKKKSAAG